MPYRLAVTLPVTLLSRNVVDRMHWAARGRYKRTLGMELMVAMSGHLKPVQALPKALLTIQIYAVRPQDEDNMVASCKPLIDLLLPPGEPRQIRGKWSVPHPGGMSIIADDNPDCLTLHIPSAVKVRRKNEQRVVVEVSEIEP